MERTFRIETERLLVRPWEERDDAGFHAMVADPEMMRHISAGIPWSEERIAEFAARQRRHLAAHGCCMGALVERRSGRLAGVSGLQPLGSTGGFEVGWWVVKDLWGQGLATEAGAACLRFGWQEMGLRRISAIAMPGNRGSIRVMEKLGMRFDRHATSRDLGLAVPDLQVVVYAIDVPAAPASSWAARADPPAPS